MPLLLTASPHPGHELRQAPEHPLSILHDVAVVDVANGQILPHRDIFLRGKRIGDIRFAASRGAGERYVISSTSAAPDLRTPVNIVRTPDEARRIYDIYYDQPVDVIAIRDLDARSFEALAERSRHDGIPFAGDLPDSAPAADAARDRMVSMEHLFGIGLAPAQALRAATLLEPAKLMRRDEEGKVKKGDIADLVVLTANPLADIHNARAIDEVVVRRKTVDSAGVAHLHP